MHFHEAAAHALADEDVSIIFGLIGDGNLYMVDSFERLVGGTFVSVVNEASSVQAAIGYARTSGKVGVATVTHGPAFTNTVTSLTEGVKGRFSIVLIAGDTAIMDRYNFQNVAQREVAACSGAGFEQVRTPQSFAEDLSTAMRRAALERRPVVLNVPINFQWEEVEYQRASSKLVDIQTVLPNPVALDTAVGIIAGAKRPIVLAGRGVATVGGRAALLRLAKRIGAPVATTLQAKDLFAGETFDLGIFGSLSNSVAAEVIGNSDCIIAFGASLNRLTTLKSSLLKKKSLVHIDIDRSAINQFSTVSAAIVADGEATADTLVAWLDEAETVATEFASDEMAKRLAHRSNDVFVDRSTRETVDVRSALDRIEKAFPADRTLVYDGGRFVLSAYPVLHAPDPSAFVHTLNYGSIGLGMGSAIGAHYGAPNRPTLLVSGDGGFMLGGLNEFNTAVRYGIDLTVIILNDGAYGAEHIQFTRKNMDPKISTFLWPDFGPVATALGGQGFTVRNLNELDEALRAVEHRSRPILIDVKIDPSVVDQIQNH